MIFAPAWRLMRDMGTGGVLDLLRAEGAALLAEHRLAWNTDPVSAARQHVHTLKRKLARAGFAHVLNPAIERSTYVDAFLAGSWACAGHPLVTLTADEACALIGERFTLEEMQHIRPPWPAFAVQLSEPLFSIDADDVALNAQSMLVGAVRRETLPANTQRAFDAEATGMRWWIKLYADCVFDSAVTIDDYVLASVPALWTFNAGTEYLAWPELVGFPRWDTMRVTADDKVVDRAMRALALALCARLDLQARA